jgi:hypothetical protein
MPRTYRKPTAKEKAKLEKSREKMTLGIEGENSMAAKIIPSMAKNARGEQKIAKEMYESVPEEAREYEAYDVAGYKSGGMVKVRGYGAARKGRGCKIC